MYSPAEELDSASIEVKPKIQFLHKYVEFGIIVKLMEYAHRKKKFQCVRTNHTHAAAQSPTKNLD